MDMNGYEKDEWASQISTSDNWNVSAVFELNGGNTGIGRGTTVSEQFC
jgi:hypothetical protein